MAKRKTADTDQTQPPPTETVTVTDAGSAEPLTSPSNGGGTEKKLPTYKVGPILTDRSNSVECAVWANEVQAKDGGTFTVHNVTLQASWRGDDGTWRQSKSFRGSQLYALIYCLQRASDFILSQRDPANQCPF